MFNNTRVLTVIPAVCAVLVVLRLTLLRTSQTSDFSLGLSTGILIGLSVLSVLSLNRRTGSPISRD